MVRTCKEEEKKKEKEVTTKVLIKNISDNDHTILVDNDRELVELIPGAYIEKYIWNGHDLKVREGVEFNTKKLT